MQQRQDAARSRIAGFDAIRGIAVGLVLIRHAAPSLVGGAGIVGVVMFFVLSGYLITGLLTGDLARRGVVRYPRFYLHRALRLYPPLLVLIATFVIVTTTIDPLGDRAKLLPSIAVALLYLADIPRLHLSSSLGHLWTLAVEEQFYLVWPVLVAAAVRVRRLGTLLAVAAIGLYVACLGTLILWHSHVELVYSLPTSWAITLVIGAAAFVYQEQLVTSVLSEKYIRWLTPVAVALLAWACFIPDAKNRPTSYLVLGPVVALCTVVVIFAVRGWVIVPFKWLRPLEWLGVISYAVYLWDLALTDWLDRGHSYDRWAAALCAVAAATVSWFVLEKPLQGVRKRIDLRMARDVESARPVMDPSEVN